MKPFSLISAALALRLVDAYLVSPPGTPAPGATKDCTGWVQQSYGLTCATIEKFYGMSTAQFEAWVSYLSSDSAHCVTQLGSGCNLIQGLYYCIQVNYVSISFLSTSPPTATPTKSSAITTTSAGNGITTPTPTQSGITNDCTTFYKVQSGDTCHGIVDKYGTFILADFSKWNPAVGADCGTLWTGYYVCVGVPGTPTTKPLPAGPSPTQAGIMQ
ncbi:LysM domain-containing protein [Tolypocladium capitatum]|uniref:LysM domain-containing protein n=1 Tax=Tolypocladium capitatum TaxID=45235 RepID=A0A2K3QKU0_9HYPO|nr:LysM domain-containing protein [Tolypocladium capitatum]